MSQYFYGELGFEAEANFDSQREAEEQAVEHSIAKGITPVCVWDADDNVLSVLVEGEIFDKRA